MFDCIATANTDNSIMLAIVTAIGGSLTTIIVGYFKYKTETRKAVARVEKEANEAAIARRDKKEQEFEAQLQRQAESHEAMLTTQQAAFQVQLDSLIAEKADLLLKIKTLEDTVESKIEQIIDLATQNSRREGMLEVLKDGNS